MVSSYIWIRKLNKIFARDCRKCLESKEKLLFPYLFKNQYRITNRDVISNTLNILQADWHNSALRDVLLIRFAHTVVLFKTIFFNSILKRFLEQNIFCKRAFFNKRAFAMLRSTKSHQLPAGHPRNSLQNFRNQMTPRKTTSIEHLKCH